METALVDFDKVVKTDKQKQDEGELLKVAEKRLETLKAQEGAFSFSKVNSSSTCKEKYLFLI